MKVLIVGAGGVGSWVAQGLSRAGHQLVVCDPDVVRGQDLARQCYLDHHVNRPKVMALEESLAPRPVWGIRKLVSAPEIPVVLGDCEVALDCTDNPGSRVMWHQGTCRVPWIHVVAEAQGGVVVPRQAPDDHWCRFFARARQPVPPPGWLAMLIASVAIRAVLLGHQGIDHWIVTNTGEVISISP